MLLVDGAPAPRPTLVAVATEWPVEPLVWLSIGAAAWWYLRAMRRLPAYPSVRRTHFLVGLGAVGAALASPLAVYADSLFWVHMVQHLLLTLVAAPLLLLGAPVTLALRSTRPAARRRWLRIVHSRALRCTTHPTVTWSAFVLVLWATHLTALYDLALENEFVHVSEHAAYLGAALVFWWPVVGLEPGAQRLDWPWRIVYLVVSIPSLSFLGVVLNQASAPLYAHYATLSRAWGPTPLSDQQLAGSVMWVAGGFLMTTALALAVLAWMRHEQRETARLDRRLDEAEFGS